MDTLDPRDNPREDLEPRRQAPEPGYGPTPTFPDSPLPAAEPYRDPMPGTDPLPGTGSSFDPWNYRPDAGWSAEHDIVGYHVEATDGKIGKIDESSHALDESYLVVDTGPWIFGTKVLIPAGTVTSVDHEDRRVYVDRTKEQIKLSPEFNEDAYSKPDYRSEVGQYYGRTYGGGPDLPPR